MKTLLTILILSLGIAIHSSAQQLTVEIGRITSQFDYQTSAGVQHEQLYATVQNGYALGYRHPLSKSKRLFYATAGLNYNGYGATGNDSEYGNSYAWSTRYVGMKLGLDAELFHKNAFSALISVSGEPEMLVSGRQTINSTTYELKGVEQFDKPYLFARGGVGINYCLGSELAFTAKYTYGRGYAMKASADGEELKIIAHQVSIGLMLSINNCEYCYPKHFDK